MEKEKVHDLIDNAINIVSLVALIAAVLALSIWAGFGVAELISGMDSLPASIECDGLSVTSITDFWWNGDGSFTVSGIMDGDTVTVSRTLDSCLVEW